MCLAWKKCSLERLKSDSSYSLKKMVLHQCIHNKPKRNVGFSRSFHCTTKHHRRRGCHSNSNYIQKRFRTINVENWPDSLPVHTGKIQEHKTFRSIWLRIGWNVCALCYNYKESFKCTQTNQPTNQRNNCKKKTMLIHCQKTKKNVTKQINSLSFFLRIFMP